MQRVIWVPGLQGQKALSSEFSNVVGANENAVQRAASDSAWRFQKLRYQSVGSTNPTLHEMEFSVMRQLRDAVKDAAGAPIVLVGSSVGFGVLVGALSRYKNSTSPLALIGFKPVPDPLMAIELQINNPAIVGAIKSGAQVPMPVESADGEKDTFTLTPAHLNDKDAHQILTHTDHAKVFNAAMAGKLLHSKIIFARGDHLTPSAHMQTFANAVTAAKTELISLDGFHGTDFSQRLYTEIREMVARFG